MKKSTLIVSLAAAGLIAVGGYSVFADNGQDSWNGWCYGPQQAYSSDSSDSRNGNYGRRGYGCGGYRSSNSDDQGGYYCPGPGYYRR